MEACIKLVNVALVLIHQTDFLLRRLLEKYKQEFLENGGIKEQMSQARRSWREEHGMGYLNGNYRKNGSNEDKFGDTFTVHRDTKTQSLISNTEPTKIRALTLINKIHRI